MTKNCCCRRDVGNGGDVLNGNMKNIDKKEVVIIVVVSQTEASSSSCQPNNLENNKETARE